MGQAFDSKYGAISTENKTFHDGEPVFIFRARDVFSLGVINEYANLCERLNVSPEHVQSVREAAVGFKEWQDDNGELVRTPGLEEES